LSQLSDHLRPGLPHRSSLPQIVPSTNRRSTPGSVNASSWCCDGNLESFSGRLRDEHLNRPRFDRHVQGSILLEASASTPRPGSAPSPEFAGRGRRSIVARHQPHLNGFVARVPTPRRLLAARPGVAIADRAGRGDAAPINRHLRAAAPDEWKCGRQRSWKAAGAYGGPGDRRPATTAAGRPPSRGRRGRRWWLPKPTSGAPLWWLPIRPAIAASTGHFRRAWPDLTW